jgi:hypothetical protein
MPAIRFSRLEILGIGRHGDIVDMKGEAQFRTGEVWEERLKVFICHRTVAPTRPVVLSALNFVTALRPTSNPLETANDSAHRLGASTFVIGRMFSSLENWARNRFAGGTASRSTSTAYVERALAR